MKPFLPFILLFLFGIVAFGFCAAVERRKHSLHSAVDVEAMLDAIAAVETGNNPRAIGRRGERSAFQIMPETWRMHTRHSFLLATQRPDIARYVARKHLAWTMELLRRASVPATPEYIAAGWRHGPGAAFRHGRSDYAIRAANLYRQAADQHSL